MEPETRHREVVIRRVVAAGRVGPQPPDLAAVARAVGEGLGVRACRLAVAGPDEPAGGSAGPIVSAEWSADSSRGVGDLGRAREVRFGHDVVGWLALAGPPIPLGSRRRLLNDLLAVLGPVLDAMRLGLALGRQLAAAAAQAEAIASARRRTVTQLDEQRRMLERNLHDGAQHHLVSLRLTVGLLEHQLTIGDDEAVSAGLGTLAEQIAQVETVLYATASGILPVSLVNDGLCAALRAEIGPGDGVTLQLPDEPHRRYPRPVETAVFYACLEAVTNARKHAPGAAVLVTLRDVYRGLWFSVRDDGPGFDPTALPAGSGLGRLSDRVGAVGGSVTAHSAPGAGTVIEGMVPI